MQVNVNMTTSEETKFSVASWWARSPEFVVAALTAQLEIARTIWPEELADTAIGKRAAAAPSPSRDG